MPQARLREDDGIVVNKWVDINYDAKEAARTLNGGTLPYSPALVTSDFPHKHEWSKDNLPEILFYLVPPISRFSDMKVELLVEDGQRVLGDRGAPLRRFEILPRHISVDVEAGWLIETWRRLDPRIRFHDILDRMVADPSYGGGIGLVKPNPNILQNYCRRGCRRLLKSWTEHGRRLEAHRAGVEALENLTSLNFTYNTVLDVCELMPNRLVKVKFTQKVPHGQLRVEKQEVSLANWEHTTLALDHFVKDVARGYHSLVDEAQLATWELLLMLQERARKHGLPHWSKLPKSCLPVTWFDRTRIKPRPNDTFDGGCDVCTWRPTSQTDAEADVTIPATAATRTVTPKPEVTEQNRVAPPKIMIRLKRRAQPDGDEEGQKAAERVKKVKKTTVRAATPRAARQQFEVINNVSVNANANANANANPNFNATVNMATRPNTYWVQAGTVQTPLGPRGVYYAYAYPQANAHGRQQPPYSDLPVHSSSMYPGFDNLGSIPLSFSRSSYGMFDPDVDDGLNLTRHPFPQL
ncbi:hypothetical protein A1O1_04447 [Capronia coronata CBS 617.96]|uniref:Uncharacterized protein n=1 Tax=Capronia coronata CBS 617.96 TaxID=1182541 RepID=W9YNW6_9EURO|nr:uncharacterized protein A1O1_04447 [Capronia coronata CBS 617.96]EXJ91335.1 hypothetical protein A1O1_04447 [Capronia coronata CBS 617.96]